MSEQTKQAPVERIRMWPLSAAIWKHSSDKGTFYNFTIDRSYKKDDGTYDSTSSFGLSDALLMAKLVNRVDSQIRKLLDADNLAARASESGDE